MSITPGVQIKCRICGESEFIEIGNREVCKYCGATYAVYDPGLEAELRMAESFREGAQFEVAAGLYGKIIDSYEGHDLSDAYWGLFLCEQQVMFETDANGVRFPSFYGVTSVAPESSEAFTKALAAARQYAPDKAAVFCELCEKIDNAKELYRRIGSEGKPFDIFICFKKTAADGVNYTKDWKTAYDLYDHLSATYNVFFSEKTLNNVVVHQYEPNIYYGLYTAKVMLLLCSKREYLESQWVKNEWSRFYAFSRNHAAGKTIIPIFIDDFTPAQLPIKLQSYQGYPADYHLFEHLTKNLQAILKPATAPTAKAEDGMAEKMAAQLAAQQAAFEKQMAALRNEMKQAPSASPIVPVVNPMADFEIEDGVLKKYKGNGGVVTIPQGVTEIGEGAFYETNDHPKHRCITAVTIPQGVTRIGESAFGCCAKLESVSLPEGLTHIGLSAFASCKALSSINIPSSVTNIAGSAFGYCSALTEIIIPRGVTRIGNSTFTNCDNLATVTLPNTVTEIAESAFFACKSLRYLSIPSNVRKIGKNAFWACHSLPSVTIPEAMTEIEEGTFGQCRALTEVEIPEGVTTIGTEAFKDCWELTTVKIPESVTSIGYQAFYHCDKIKSVSCTKKWQDVIRASIGLNGYSVSFTTITTTFDIKNGTLKDYNGDAGEVVIPEGVTKIGTEAFWDRGVTAITIPKSVTEIDYRAFAGCEKLERITVAAGNPKYVAVQNCLIDREAKALVLGCKNSVIPNDGSVTVIGCHAFADCVGLTEIKLPQSITVIGEHAFRGCHGLVSVEIPKSVTEFKMCPFVDCPALARLTVEEGNPNYYSVQNCIVERDGKMLLVGCKNSVIPMDGSVTGIGWGAFCGCTGLTKLTIPDGVKKIDWEAFYGCTGLISLVVPKSVKYLSDHAFKGCVNLTEIDAPFLLKGKIKKHAKKKVDLKYESIVRFDINSREKVL